MSDPQDPEIEFSADNPAGPASHSWIEGLEPASDPDLAVVSCGRPGSTPPRCAVLLHALADMFGHGATEPRREVGGVLLGEVLHTSVGLLTRVVDMIPALLADTGITHMTFTHSTWEQINASLDEREGGLRIVGWYHTHPGFGPFYSAHDRFIHENFFADRTHVGLVLDPVQSSLSMYGWREDAVVRGTGIAVVAGHREGDELREYTGGLRYVADPRPGLAQRIRGIFGQ